MMDIDRFDALARSLTTGWHRRRLLAALPLGVTLISLLDDAREASAQDDDHGSSHRRHRRKARHRHNPGEDKNHRARRRPRKDKRKDIESGPSGVIRPECEGKADRTCCGGADSGQWCQNGACEAIPDDATATLRECGGRCDCVVPACGGTLIGAEQAVCGKVLTCTFCLECPFPPHNCGGSGVMRGPAGLANYCFTPGTGGDCAGPNFHEDCPRPSEQACLVNVCQDICFGA
jgi:hypothetical protein